MSKETIELRIVAYQPIKHNQVNETELQHLSIFLTEIVAEMLQHIEQDKE